MSTNLKSAHKKSAADYSAGLKKSNQYFRHNFLPHLPAAKEAPILEIGSGLGQFIAFCQAEGYNQALGLDLSPDNVQFCKAQGLNVVLADANNYLEEYQDKYDVIVMNDVIEHQNKEQVWALLSLIFNSLTPGGTLLIKTFNMANPLMGGHSRYIDFTHETGWTEESMIQVLGMAKYKNVRVYPSNLFVYFYNPLNYLAAFIQLVISSALKLYFRANGRTTTNVFTKNLIAVGTKPKE